MHTTIDQFSKVPEVDIVKSTRYDKLTPVLDRVFATHGVPEEFSSDNGAPYSGGEMRRYAKEIGLNLTPVSPDLQADPHKLFRKQRPA